MPGGFSYVFLQGLWRARLQGACPPIVVAKGKPLVQPAADVLNKGGLEAAKDPNLPQMKLVWVRQRCSRFISQPNPGKQFLLSPRSQISPRPAQGVPRQVRPATSPLAPPHLCSASFPFFSRNELLLHLKTYNIYYEGQNLQLRHREVRNPQGRHPTYLWQQRENQGNWV